jgi:hypothetical protein
MSRRLAVWLCVVSAAPLAACASGGGSQAPSDASASSSSSRNSESLSREEILASQETTIYDAILRLRPQFFTTRGLVSSTQPEANVISVYIDGARQADGVESLKRISANQVRSVQHLTAAAATQRFGVGNSSGTIVVTLQ